MSDEPDDDEITIPQEVFEPVDRMPNFEGPPEEEHEGANDDDDDDEDDTVVLYPDTYYWNCPKCGYTSHTTGADAGDELICLDCGAKVTVDYISS